METLGAIAGVIGALAALVSVWAVFEIDRRAAAREKESRKLSDERAIQAEERMLAREADREARSTVAGVRKHNAAVTAYIERAEAAARTLNQEVSRLTAQGSDDRPASPHVQNAISPIHAELQALECPSTFEPGSKVAAGAVVTLTETDLFGMFAGDRNSWLGLCRSRAEGLEDQASVLRRAAWPYPTGR